MKNSLNDPEIPTREQQDFLESIPYYTLQHTIYRDDLDNIDADLSNTSANRLTAVVALILLAVIAVALGLLLAWGISALQAANQPEASRSILEI
jgi:hypothetical protein